jgi:hypothetical protein
MRSTSSLRAVSMMIGTCELARSSRHSVSPSSPGSMTSSTIRSTRPRLNTRRISFPSRATLTRSPFFSRYSASSVRISWSSSTTTMCDGWLIEAGLYIQRIGRRARATVLR